MGPARARTEWESPRDDRLRRLQHHPPRRLRRARLPASGLGEAAARGPGPLVGPQRGDPVLGDHQARRHRDDRQAPGDLPERAAARDRPRARAAQHVPADPDPARPAQARDLPPADLEALHAALPEAHPRRHRAHRQGHRRRAGARERLRRVRLRARGLRAAADRGDRVAARRARIRLEAALRLDQPHHRRGRSGVPGGRQDAAGDRAAGDDGALPLLHEAGGGEAQAPRRRPGDAVRGPRSGRQADPADRRAHLLPDHRHRRQRDHAQRDHRRHARARRAPGRAAQAPAQPAAARAAPSRRWCAGSAR